ncbi:hypothetical protein MAR_004409 [Mya arenaria]|uniref:Uncharacterized protein n=1 Tax=Mya arenaria TaxID=6604 RepID=A0ABY7EZ97_MYAAR|nr:hypothetical protein MAR_004409 [Mya arenaria]
MKSQTVASLPSMNIVRSPEELENDRVTDSVLKDVNGKHIKQNRQKKNLAKKNWVKRSNKTTGNKTRTRI